jgi:hypothetical protein
VDENNVPWLVAKCFYLFYHAWNYVYSKGIFLVIVILEAYIIEFDVVKLDFRESAENTPEKSKAELIERLKGTITGYDELLSSLADMKIFLDKYFLLQVLLSMFSISISCFSLIIQSGQSTIIQNILATIIQISVYGFELLCLSYFVDKLVEAVG